MEHRVGDIPRPQAGEFFQLSLVVFRQPSRLVDELGVHQRVGGVEIQFQIRKYPDDVGLELAVIIVRRREFDGFLPDVGLGDFERAGVFVHAEDVAEEDLRDEDAAVLKVLAAAEAQGGLDVGG